MIDPSSVNRNPDCRFELVSAKTQPVSAGAPPGFRIFKIHRAETYPRKSWPSVLGVRYLSTETGLLDANLPKCRHFAERGKSLRRDRCGWLGRQDSNLGMAESKSDKFPNPTNVGSDKSGEFASLSISRLALSSECGTYSSQLPRTGLLGARQDIESPPRAASWWLPPSPTQPHPHMNAPPDLNALSRWLLGSVGYIRQELAACISWPCRNRPSSV
jgi:hypothetical protein